MVVYIPVKLYIQFIVLVITAGCTHRCYLDVLLVHSRHRNSITCQEQQIIESSYSLPSCWTLGSGGFFLYVVDAANMAKGYHTTVVVVASSSSFIVDNWPATGGLSIKRQQPRDIGELGIKSPGTGSSSSDLTVDLLWPGQVTLLSEPCHDHHRCCCCWCLPRPGQRRRRCQLTSTTDKDTILLSPVVSRIR